MAVNPAWRTVLGWNAEDLHNRRFLELVHPDDVARTLRELARLGEGLTTFNFENRYRTKNGDYRVIAWLAVPSTVTV